MNPLEQVKGLIKIKQLPITSIICRTGMGFGEILYQFLSTTIHPKAQSKEVEKLTKLFNEDIKAIFFVQNKLLKKHFIEKSQKYLKNHDSIECVVLNKKEIKDYFILESDLLIFDESFLLQDRKLIRYISQESKKHNKMVIFLSRIPNLSLTYESFIVLENDFGNWKFTKNLSANNLL